MTPFSIVPQCMSQTPSMKNDGTNDNSPLLFFFPNGPYFSHQCNHRLENPPLVALFVVLFLEDSSWVVDWSAFLWVTPPRKEYPSEWLDLLSSQSVLRVVRVELFQGISIVANLFFYLGYFPPRPRNALYPSILGGISRLPIGIGPLVVSV